ncbi:MAG: response regulator transcription factor [Chloroflexi bacterium]|nr:response regulator transcription factor [Chloroflexota bacterium]MBV9897775.1 response regulator transcription factor [Chloroflexota bacterium]
MSREPVRVLVVDDDEKIAAALRRALIYEGYTVTVAGDGHAALARLRDETPDLVILDLMLPGVDGIEVCRRLRADDANGVPVLMLTARDTTADRVTGLDIGADDYLAKPFAYEELLARVRALLRRARPAPSTDADTLTYADLHVDLKTRDVRRADRAVQLTAQEFNLLSYFLRHPRQVLSRDQLLEHVWGFGQGVTSNVVDVYVGYVRQKLESNGEPRLLHTMRGVGYVLRSD